MNNAMIPPNLNNSLQKEGRISLAILVFNRNQFRNAKLAASAFQVPYTTLRRRLSGIQAQQASRSPSRKLSQSEEIVLIQ